jgi:hypothetical protein
MTFRHGAALALVVWYLMAPPAFPGRADMPLSGANTFTTSTMAQPKRDHCAIHAVLKQLHGGAVTQHVRCYAFALERRACPGGQVDVLADDALDRIAAEPIAAIAHEGDAVGEALVHRSDFSCRIRL